MWNKTVDIKPGADKQQLLCAWTTSSPQHQWSYGVLILWPDGVWTDAAEDTVLPGEMPDLCRAIEHSAQAPAPITDDELLNLINTVNKRLNFKPLTLEDFDSDEWALISGLAKAIEKRCGVADQ